MCKLYRKKYIDKSWVKKCLAAFLVLLLITGCGKKESTDQKNISGARDESSFGSHVDFSQLKKQNEDIFAWLYVPDTAIDYPVCQSMEGDDSYYISHNAMKQEDPKGAIYTECANLKNMCDFNEVLHGSSPSDGSMFSDLQKFLDRKYFDEHEYIYIYTEGNALIYMTFAAFVREDIRLLAQYDFTYASGCQAFLDEIYENKSMNKIVRNGWEKQVEPENFIITLTTHFAEDPSKQVVVVGCLVGDVRGEIDRVMDYSDPESEE